MGYQSAALLGLALALAGCSSKEPVQPGEGPVLDWPCEIDAAATGDSAPDYVTKTGCEADFQTLASAPLDASIPGARSAKVVYDLHDSRLYFQNSKRFEIHFQFATEGKIDGDPSKHLFTGVLSDFNPQYTAPKDLRKFYLGAVTYYEQPKVWALEIAPYDTSTPAMIEELFNAVKDHAFYGPALKFHPTSENVAKVAAMLPKSVPVVTTEQLYAAIDYQPLNLGVTIGNLKILKAEQLATEYVSIKDIVVLDAVPNDIAPVAGIVTEEFQTPLSHINVLARNRGTPNMGLRKATTHPDIAPYAGKPVRLTVDTNGWKVEPVTSAEATDWFNTHAPEPVNVPLPNVDVKDLRDIETVTEHTDVDPYVSFEQIAAATRAFGAKAANYSVFATDPKVPHKKAFAIPVFYYDQYMEENGVFDQIAEWQKDPNFEVDDALRDANLAKLRDVILKGTFNSDFQALLKAKLDKDYPGESMRFRSSTNAEDLNAFPCAGCYDSHTGDPVKYAGDQLAACLDAIRKTWATAWNKRTYDERAIHKINHRDVAMALLVHTNFPAEEANGVAITANIFDATGNAPGYYVNVQYGGQYEVVHPPAGITSDSFLYQYSFANQPVIYYTSSNALPPGQEHVLTPRQIFDLGVALERLHTRFSNAYRDKQNPTAWYAIDSEFKFDDFANPGQPATLYIKQARPYPASSSVSSGD